MLDDVELKKTVLDIQDRILKICHYQDKLTKEFDTPSDYWQHWIKEFSYLFQPDNYHLFRELRHHTYHVTGERPEDYPTANSLGKRYKNISTPTWIRDNVSEPAQLGGFGERINGKVINRDIIRFLIAFSTLYQGGVLSPTDAPEVLEIGGGYGGFAHHFKRVIPQSTYVIVDLPETLLFSATYLRLMNPDKRVHIYDPEDNQQTWEQIRTHNDFVLLPTWKIATVPDGCLDLVINGDYALATGCGRIAKCSIGFSPSRLNGLFGSLSFVRPLLWGWQ